MLTVGCNVDGGLLCSRLVVMLTVGCYVDSWLLC